MKFMINMSLGAALLVGAVLPAFAADVKTDYDHGADFTQFHTYTWGNVTTTNPFYVDRIKQAVDSQLQADGWRLVPSGGQTTVFATDGIHNEQQLETSYDGFGGGWGGGWGWGRWGGMGGMGGMGESTTQTVDQRVGKLVVDVFESNSKHLLWRGSVTSDLSNKSEKNAKELNENIAKMLKGFPPKGK